MNGRSLSGIEHLLAPETKASKSPTISPMFVEHLETALEQFRESSRI
jgi:hypothetical protein